MKKLCVLLSLVAFPSLAQAEWIKLGERAVSHRAEKDTIFCQHQGALNGMQFRIKFNDVRILRFEVVYANGTRQVMPVNRVVRAGQSSPYIDLPGIARVVRSVNIWYKTINRRGPQAHLALFGRVHAAPPPPPPPAVRSTWIKLGSLVVNHRAERDTIRCAHEGALKGIQFRVKFNDVRFLRFTVVYANGSQQNLPVNAVVRAGQSSGYYDLPGRARVVRSINFWYKTLNPRGPRARVDVYAKQ